MVVLGNTSSVPGAAPSLVVSTPIPDQATQAGASFEMALPTGTFLHTDANASVSLEAQQANGSPLPAWLAFDPSSGKFNGQPPPGFSGTLHISVIARDSQGREAVTTFEIEVGKEHQNGHRNDGRQGDASRGNNLRHDSAIQSGTHHAWLDLPANKQKLITPVGRASFSEQLAQHGRQASDIKRQAFLGRIGKNAGTRPTA